MSKSPSRKSIIANFGELAAGIDPGVPSSGGTIGAQASPHDGPLQQAGVPRVGAGVIGATQRAISDIRDERDRLRALLDAGTSPAQELDPGLVDPSPFPDRLRDDNDAEFETFKRTIGNDGQKVPVQVRPHPSSPGRYQVIYGHRRLRAASELGLKLRALIVDMSDHDLVVSQGIENASRQDLTWIERAVFASRMDSAAVKPREIKSALVIDDAELAKMRLVARVVPRSLIEMIGRAPKIGRPRWLDLAQTIEAAIDGVERAHKTLSADKVSGLSSDDRFRYLLSALKTVSKRVEKNEGELRDEAGVVVGRVRSSAKEFRLSIEDKRGTGFFSFLENELPDLFKRFSEQSEDS